MRKSNLAVCGALILGYLCLETQAAEVLRITPESGSIEFVGAKDDGTHKGGFKKFSGTVKLVPEKLAESQVIRHLGHIQSGQDAARDGLRDRQDPQAGPRRVLFGLASKIRPTRHHACGQQQATRQIRLLDLASEAPLRTGRSITVAFLV